MALTDLKKDIKELIECGEDPSKTDIVMNHLNKGKKRMDGEQLYHDVNGIVLRNVNDNMNKLKELAKKENVNELETAKFILKHRVKILKKMRTTGGL